MHGMRIHCGIVGDGADEREDAPEENQHAERYGDFFGEPEAEEVREVEQPEIEEDVAELAREIEAGGLAFFDQLGEPRVVEVAAEVAGFDVAMPEAWQEQDGGDVEDVRPMVGRGSARRRLGRCRQRA